MKTFTSQLPLILLIHPHHNPHVTYSLHHSQFSLNYLWNMSPRWSSISFRNKPTSSAISLLVGLSKSCIVGFCSSLYWVVATTSEEYVLLILHNPTQRAKMFLSRSPVVPSGLNLQIKAGQTPTSKNDPIFFFDEAFVDSLAACVVRKEVVPLLHSFCGVHYLVFLHK